MKIGTDPIDIYELLPEVYRREDARRGYPLKALLGIVSEQANIVKDDILGYMEVVRQESFLAE